MSKKSCFIFDKENYVNNLVSIIMPTYNNVETVKNSVLSIINQTYKNWELIIIDDNGKQSKTHKEIERLIYTLNEGRIIYLVNEKNMGSAKSRNKGILSAKGEYITFLDDDDIYLPKKIEKQLTFMLNGNYDYSISNLKLFNDNGKLVRIRKHDYLNGITNYIELLKLHMMYHLTGTDTFMFKKEYLLNIGMFDEIDMGDEFYLMTKAILGKGKFGYFNDFLVNASIHSSGCGLSAGENKIKWENILYKSKSRYFELFNKNTIRKIKMRHFMVIAFAYLRKKNYYMALKNIIISFINSPNGFIYIAFNERLFKR